MAEAIRVYGLEEKIRDLRGYARDAQDMRDPLEAHGSQIVTDARAVVSVDSGALRASVTLTVRDVELVVTAGTGTDGDYAGIDNYGDPNTGRPGTHFLTGTDDEPALTRRVEAELDRNHARNHL